MIHVDPTDPAVLDHLVESLDEEGSWGGSLRDLARAALAALEDVSTAGWSRPRVVTTADVVRVLGQHVVMTLAGQRSCICPWRPSALVPFEGQHRDHVAEQVMVLWSPPVESGETQGGGR